MSVKNFELSKHLRFSPAQGLIDLAGSRVMLFNQSAMASLWRTLYDQVGTSMSRMVMARFGYESAVRDYQALERLFPDLSVEDRLEIGPLMHSWSGIVGVEPEVTEFDAATGAFYFKGRWINSYEARLHLDQFGISERPVCFSLAGYGSGWCSSWFGRRLLEVETKCVACGDPYCEWEIRPWDEWGEEARPWKLALSGTSKSIHRELENTARDLRNLNETISQSVEVKAKAQRDYLRVICHDIEAPLKLAASALNRLGHEDPGVEVAATARGLARIQSVIDRAKLAVLADDEKVPVNLAVCSLNQTLLEAAQNLAGRAAFKNVKIETRLNEAISVRADQQMLTEQVLGNVLSNAVKFSAPEGTVQIDVSQDASGFAIIEISDRGRGIPRELLSSLFDPRKTVSTAGTMGEVGLGYGLSIVKSSMEAMNGRVDIESISMSDNPSAHGTKVRLWLPCGDLL